ncbi:MAG: hypothetical protein SOH81_06710 [Acetobacter sp.]
MSDGNAMAAPAHTRKKACDNHRTVERRVMAQARKLIVALKEKNDTETVLKLRRMIGPVAMTPAAGQSGLRFTLRARRVCEG